MVKYSLVFFLSIPFIAFCQRIPDEIYFPTIHSVKLFQENNQESIPLINLNSSDLLELHFDDLDTDVKTYFYTYQLCNADWQPADLSSFDFIKGYQQQRLSQYRISSITLSKYVHYQAILPDRNCRPTKSGNYLLKVFLNGDTSKLAFTKRLYVIDSHVGINGRILQPFNNELLQTHQKLQFTIDITQLNAPNPVQQLKVFALQNYNWNEAISNLQPAFIRGNQLEYNGEQDCLFESGKEHRWADLRTYRYESDRVARINKDIQPNFVLLQPDGNRTNTRYIYYRDLNGWMDISTVENANLWWQTDYADVVFTFVPDGNKQIVGKDVYLFGELTNRQLNESSKMQFNPNKGVYQKNLLLKQGYYSYSYRTLDPKNPTAHSSVAQTEGNYWETENDYIVMVYYRSYSGRHDELVGLVTVNSRTGRAGY